MLRMSRRILLSLSVGLVILVAALMLSSLRVPKAVAQGIPDVRPALSTPAELPGFERYRMIATGKGSKRILARRRADGLTIEVVVYVAPTEVEAQRVCQRATITQLGPGPMPKGSPTGRKIGQEVWMSHRGGAEPLHSIKIIARDGRSIVIASLSLPVETDENGRPVWDTNGRPIPKLLKVADLQLAENHAIKALDKLTRMGHTSRSR